jgi:hypothetical protein
MPNSNVELLTKVAKRLGPLLREVVFVDGCTTALLITDEAAAEVRPTFDVDVIAEITTYAGYTAFSEQLRALGFREDSSKGAHLCRWLIDAIKLAVMLLEEKILGFTNRWYRAAMEAAHEIAWSEPLERDSLMLHTLRERSRKVERKKGQRYSGSASVEDCFTFGVIDSTRPILDLSDPAS